jgi:hypothetical protein
MGPLNVPYVRDPNPQQRRDRAALFNVKVNGLFSHPETFENRNNQPKAKRNSRFDSRI